MSFLFFLLIGIQVTFALGLVWFWVERWEDVGSIPTGGWLVAAIPIASFGIGLMVGPQATLGEGAAPTMQDTVAFVTMWGSYVVGAVVTLLAARTKSASR